jgi:hypothetical protein
VRRSEFRTFEETAGLARSFYKYNWNKQLELEYGWNVVSMKPFSPADRRLLFEPAALWFQFFSAMRISLAMRGPIQLERQVRSRQAVDSESLQSSS